MVENEHVVHPGRRLGKRPPTPSKPRLAVRNLLTGYVPQVPLATDHFAQVSGWGLYRNDEFGVCGPTSVANSRKLITKVLTGTEESPAQDDVFDLYRRSGNPNFDPVNYDENSDQGVILQDMLSEVVKNGIGGTKALAFAEVDHTSLTALRQAVAIFGFLIIGVDLKTPQQDQTDQHLWNAVGGGEWGGHAILGGRYRDESYDMDDRFGVVTWAELVDMTDNFITQQLDEAWVLIWPEHYLAQQFLQGVDQAALGSAFQALTGRAFPAVPQPLSSNVLDDPAYRDRIATSALRSHMSRDEWVRHHFMSYFGVK